MAAPIPIRRSTSQPPNPNCPNRRTLTLKPSSSSSSSSTLTSVLTEERLLDHNRRPSNAASPYYRGLTDSALYFRSLGLSPSRESFASSTRSNSSTSSSVLLVIQGWVPFFFMKSRRKREVDGDLPKTSTPGGEEPPRGTRMPLRESDLAPAPPAAGAATHATAAGGGGEEPPRGSRRPLRESDLAAAPPATGTVAPPATGTAAPPATGTAAVCKPRKEREYVLAYKYRPRFLEEFICNRDQAEELQEMVRKQQCGHFIFEGPTGVGRGTMVLAFLRGLFGAENLKTKNELKKIELKGEHITSIDVNLKISSQHVEINLSELHGYEKHVIVALINESMGPRGKNMLSDCSNCRAIVVRGADKLSTDAQHYLRWIMEKYEGCNKLFFCCYDSSKLQAIKQLCKIIKLKQPADSEIVDVLEFIAKKEYIELPHHVAEKIAKSSKNNLRQAIRSFEASWKSNHSFKDDKDILTGWEEDIANIAKSIVKEQSPKQLYMIRGKLKNLIEHDVSPDFIFDNLTLELKKLLDHQLQAKVDAMYQEYKIYDNGPPSNPENSLASSLVGREDSGGNGKVNEQRKNVQYFMKIEEFTAKFMSFYKSFVNKGYRRLENCT